jgi:hypothetical protein
MKRLLFRVLAVVRLWITHILIIFAAIAFLLPAVIAFGVLSAVFVLATVVLVLAAMLGAFIAWLGILVAPEGLVTNIVQACRDEPVSQPKIDADLAGDGK